LSIQPEVLRVEGLRRTQDPGRLGQGRHGIDFHVNQSRTLGIVGESGCGKSVTSLSIMRLLPRNGRIIAGRILLEAGPAQAPEDDMRGARGNDVSMIFQER